MLLQGKLLVLKKLFENRRRIDLIIKDVAHKYGDNVDTDVILPARYITLSDPKELAKHCMEDIDKDFIKQVNKGDVIVDGENFGCGSSREHAPIAIKASGVSCIIAKSFARIFYRNAINIGLPIIDCFQAVEDISNKENIQIDLELGIIKNLDNKKTYQVQIFPEFIKKIINAKGLLNLIKNEGVL